MADVNDLVEMMKKRSDLFNDITPKQAEAMAVRLSGSVEAYIEYLNKNDEDTAKIERITNPHKVSPKFVSPMSIS